MRLLIEIIALLHSIDLCGKLLYVLSFEDNIIIYSNNGKYI